MVADAFNSQTETNETNNVRSTPLHIKASDLVVTAATAPTTASERSMISLTWTVANQGQAAAATDWYDYVYLSDNTTLDSSDRSMGYLWTGDKTPLAAGASYTATKDMWLPERIGAGKQYLLFVADRDGYQTEYSDTNNVRAIPLDITLPDLVTTGAIAPVAVTVGSTADLSWTVTNQGSVNAGHNWYDRIYLSNDRNLDASDTHINYFDSGTPYTSLAAGDSYTLTKTVNIPQTALGNRYLLFVADADNWQYETNENNNINAIPVEVNAPDLIVSGATVPTVAALGEAITVNWQVNNQGSVPAAADWYDYFFLSDDQTLDSSDQYITYKWTGDKTPLASNSNYSATHNFTIPTDAKAGDRYLLFVADRDNYQGETNESNNVYAVPITIKAPDLVIAEATAPATADPNSSFSVSYTVNNQGQIATTQGRWPYAWYDRIFLSYDPIYDTSDTELSSRGTSETPQLAIDGSYKVDTTVTLPNNAVGQPGTRYLLFTTDTYYYSNQSETSESNNVLALPLIITGENADLTVTATAPSQASVQQNIPVSWTVKNTGTLNATGYYGYGYWYDRVYISTDSTLDANDTYLREDWTGYQTLADQGQYSMTRDVTIPQGRFGEQYLLFVTDIYNYQGELSETNNVSAVPIIVQAPDLVVTNATAPTQAYAGARMEVVWTVSNQGDGTATAGWYDSVYLSDDNTLNTASDTLLKNTQNMGALKLIANSTSYTVTQMLSVPNNAMQGSKYLLFVADRGNQQGEVNESNNIWAVPINIGNPDPDLPLLTTGATIQNQNNPQLVTNPNIGTYVNLPSLPYIDSSATGLLGQYYFSSTGNFPDFNAIPPVLAQVDSQVDIYDSGFANAGFNDYFAVQWTGFLDIATDGDVTFFTSSDDGSRLYIDNQLVVDNGGLHGMQERSGTINLARGKHDLRLEFFEHGGGAGVSLSYTPVGGSKQVIPTNVLTPTVLTSPAEDLRLSGATAPTLIGRGQTIGTSWTVTNQSSNSTQGLWSDQVYLSDDATLDSKDTRLAGFGAGNTSLGANESYTQTQSITIPNNIGFGNKYLIFATNPYKPEGDRTNNAYALPVTISNPDLIVTEVTAPISAAERSQITVNWTEKNRGDVPANENWLDRVYLSDNTIFDSSDIHMDGFWTGGNLAAGATRIQSRTFNLPQNTGSGRWYVLVVADSDSHQGETSNSNNVFAAPIDITIPDLTVTTAIAPTSAAVRQSLPVSWTVTNNGTVAAAADRYDSVYISDDDRFDPATDTYVTDFFSSGSEPLNAGASKLRTENITIPNSKLGNRYLLFVSDRTATQSETNENNNVFATPIAITAPDLAVSSATVPTSTALGQVIPVTWSVTNEGNVTAEGDWIDAFYLSDDAILDGSDQQIDALWTSDSTPVNTGGNYNLTRNITIPTDATPGSRFLPILTDRDNHQGETNESNNVKAVPITINAADLVVSDATASATTTPPGSSLDLSYTVKNQGQVTTNQGWPYGWRDAIFLSNDPIYDSSDTLLTNRWNSTNPALAVGETYQATQSVTLPNNVIGQPGKRYLLVVTDYDSNYQKETNEANNTFAVPITIAGDNADLVVTAAFAPIEASVQQSVSVSWTVKNTGNLNATGYGYWYDRIYISSDNTLDASDTYLTEAYDYRNLTPNQEYALTRNITLPQGRTGTQYLLIQADNYNYQGEIDETNNVLAVPIEVKAPDLIVSNATAPVKSYAGRQIEVGWTVANQGNADAIADWYDRVYLSDDTIFNPNTDTYLEDAWTGSFTPLKVGENYDIKQLLTLPSTTASGSRYLLFVTDKDSYQGETNESNNVTAIPIIIGDQEPDLAVTTATAPSTAALGEAISVNWEVLNQGNVDASADWYDTIYLSDDQTLNETDVAVYSQSVADQTPLFVNATYSLTKNITIPNTTTGNRYLLFVADAGKQQNESNETNNVKAVSITLTAPDLVVAEANTAVTSATWGETIQASWTVTNQGTVTAATNWGDQIYLSDDTTLDGTDRFVASLSAASKVPLASSGVYTQTLDITIPNNLGIGNKYLLFVTDANDAQGETNNSNNVKAVSFDLKAPNLQVTDTNAPTTATWGEDLALSWNVKNQGTGAALADWSDYVYLSSNPTWDSSDISLGNVSAATQSPLAAGSSYTLNRNVTIPAVTPGNWYLLFATDFNNNQQPETNETDNVRAVALEVKAPDLIVSAATAPATGILGEALAVDWTVTNQGGGSALTDWYDYVYLSTDQSLDSNDISLGYQWTGDKTPLAAGASYTVGRNVTVPNVNPGAWYLLFAADRDNSQAEADNSNNVKSVAITLAAPDIELTTTTAPTTASLGETISVGWTVTNTGNFTASASWDDYVYLSNDAILDNSDTQLGYLSASR